MSLVLALLSSGCTRGVLALGQALDFLSEFSTADLPALEVASYTDIVGNPREQVVVFYRRSKGAETAEAALEVVRRVMHAVNLEPSLLFSQDPKRNGKNFLYWRECDGDLPENQAGFAEAQFGDAVYIFTSTPVEGIVKYEQPLQAATLLRYLQFRYPSTRRIGDVRDFRGELDFWRMMDYEGGRPIVAMFTQEGCSYCNRMRLNFATVASHYKDQVIAVEVDCSKSEEASKFCTRHGATNQGMPAFQLFDGVQVTTLPDGARANHNYGLWDVFFKRSLPDVDPAAAVGEFQEEYEGSGAAKKIKKKKKREKKTEGKKKEQEKNTGMVEKKATAEGKTAPLETECPPCSSSAELAAQMKSLVRKQLHVIDAKASLGYLPKKDTAKMKELLAQQLELLGEKIDHRQK
jgi:thiol-disulfide isomerase/thioredoxin